MQKALDKANFYLSSPEIDDDMFNNNSDNESPSDNDNVQDIEDCLSGDDLVDHSDVECVDIINRSNYSSPPSRFEEDSSGYQVVDYCIKELIDMTIHEVKHNLDIEVATMAECIVHGIVTEICIRDTQIEITDDTKLENEIYEANSKYISKHESLKISEDLVYDIFESLKATESPWSHFIEKEETAKNEDNNSLQFEVYDTVKDYYSNEYEKSEKVYENEHVPSSLNAESTENFAKSQNIIQNIIQNDIQNETQNNIESASQKGCLSSVIEENEELIEEEKLISEKGKYSRQFCLNLYLFFILY